jgi:hypothetical protein
VELNPILDPRTSRSVSVRRFPVSLILELYKVPVHLNENPSGAEKYIPGSNKNIKKRFYEFLKTFTIFTHIPRLFCCPITHIPHNLIKNILD